MKPINFFLTKKTICIILLLLSTQIVTYKVLAICIKPTVVTEPSDKAVPKNSIVHLVVTALGTEPLTYLWLKDNVVLENTNSTLTIDSFSKDDEGTYMCILTNGCGIDSTTPAVLSLAPSICLVTVKTANRYDKGRVLVFWDKESNITGSAFKIYRADDVLPSFSKIGSVLYNAFSEYVDSLANPKEQAYTYVLTKVGIGGLETIIDSSQTHKTMHLTVTRGKTNGALLNWNPYIGFSYDTFFIYRSVNSENFTLAKKVISSVHTWTDDTVVGTSDTLFYYVAVKKAGGCNPTSGAGKAGGDIYSQSVSNMEDNRLQGSGIGSTKSDFLNLSCLPNPFNKSATISYYLGKSSDVKLELYNILGEKVAVLVNTRQLKGDHCFVLKPEVYGLGSGVYLLKLSAENKTKIMRLVGLK